MSARFQTRPCARSAVGLGKSGCSASWPARWRLTPSRTAPRLTTAPCGCPVRDSTPGCRPGAELTRRDFPRVPCGHSRQGGSGPAASRGAGRVTDPPASHQGRHQAANSLGRLRRPRPVPGWRPGRVAFRLEVRSDRSERYRRRGCHARMVRRRSDPIGEPCVVGPELAPQVVHEFACLVSHLTIGEEVALDLPGQ